MTQSQSGGPESTHASGVFQGDEDAHAHDHRPAEDSQQGHTAVPLVMDARQLAGFSGADVPAEGDMYRCVHCGLCLSSCPTYGVTGLEMESPRGRIALMKAVNEGRVGISDRIVSHWEACLSCRACEAVCPSGVPYGRMMERTRAQVRAQGKQSASVKSATRWFLRLALPRPRLLRLGGGLLRLYQRTGMQKLARGLGLTRLLPGGVRRMEAQLPRMSGQFFGPSRRVYRPNPAPQVAGPEAQSQGAGMKVALLSGCVMPMMQAATMNATVRVLVRNGCEVAVPTGQGCCGALNTHAGDLETARAMARRNIDALLSARGRPHRHLFRRLRLDDEGVSRAAKGRP